MQNAYWIQTFCTTFVYKIDIGIRKITSASIMHKKQINNEICNVIFNEYEFLSSNYEV